MSFVLCVLYVHSRIIETGRKLSISLLVIALFELEFFYFVLHKAMSTINDMEEPYI